MEQLPSNLHWFSIQIKAPALTEPLMGFSDLDFSNTPILKNYKRTVLAYNKILGIYKAVYTKTGWTEISSFGSNRVNATPEYWTEIN